MNSINPRGDSAVRGFRTRTSFALALLAAIVAACGDPEPDASPIPCSVTLPTECPEPSPTYVDVAPIFKERCVSCHEGVPNGPWRLDNWRHIADWQAIIRAELASCSMPPRDSDVSMSTEERFAILEWIRCGSPE